VLHFYAAHPAQKAHEMQKKIVQLFVFFLFRCWFVLLLSFLGRGEQKQKQKNNIKTHTAKVEEEKAAEQQVRQSANTSDTSVLLAFCLSVSWLVCQSASWSVR